MAATFHVDIVSAESEIWSGDAGALFANGEMGELGIYPRHTPLLFNHLIRILYKYPELLNNVLRFVPLHTQYDFSVG